MENEVQKQLDQPVTKSLKEPLTLKGFIVTVKKNKKLSIVIIAIIFLFFSSILFAILYSLKLKTITQKPATQEIPKQESYGSLLLTPVNIIGTPGKKTSVDVIINTDARKISGVVISVKYNPNLLDNVTITPYQDNTSALGYSLKLINPDINDPTPGEKTITLKLSDGMQELAGSGKIAEISFIVKPVNVAVLNTKLELTQLNGFMYRTKGEHTNITKNQVIISLPAELKHLSTTPAINK